jgi:hypothetical protein
VQEQGAHVDCTGGGGARKQRRLLRVKGEGCAASADAEVDADVGGVGVHHAARRVPGEDVADVVLEKRAAAAAGRYRQHAAAAVPGQARDGQGARGVLWSEGGGERLGRQSAQDLN